MNIAVIIGVIVAALALVAKVLGLTSSEKEKKLEGQNNQVTQKLEANAAERETLKDKAQDSQANATEEQKSDFWKKEIE